MADRGMNTLRNVTAGLLAEGIDVRVSTCGRSMYPLIKTGERVIISSERNFSPGDLVVYKRDEAMVCHRIVRTYVSDGELYYQTRGDAFFLPDQPVAADRILGRVMSIERDNVTILRRMFLIIYPVLSYGRLNAFVVNWLLKCRAVVHSGRDRLSVGSRQDR